MSAAHHTPGPWFPTRDSRWNPVCRIGRAWDISTKLPLSEFGHPDMDAHLIASAPELLKALQAIVPILEEWHTQFPSDVGDNEPPALKAARAAVAKATGSAA